MERYYLNKKALDKLIPLLEHALRLEKKRRRGNEFCRNSCG